jgi:hypothetical protein
MLMAIFEGADGHLSNGSHNTVYSLEWHPEFARMASSLMAIAPCFRSNVDSLVLFVCFIDGSEHSLSKSTIASLSAIYSANTAYCRGWHFYFVAWPISHHSSSASPATGAPASAL